MSPNPRLTLQIQRHEYQSLCLPARIRCSLLSSELEVWKNELIQMNLQQSHRTSKGVSNYSPEDLRVRDKRADVNNYSSGVKYTRWLDLLFYYFFYKWHIFWFPAQCLKLQAWKTQATLRNLYETWHMVGRFQTLRFLLKNNTTGSW